MVLLGVTAAALGPAIPAVPASAATAARSPLDALPVGRAPRSIPYAIGTVVYYQGHRTDVRARFDQTFPASNLTPAQRQLTTVVSGGGYAWAQLSAAATDIAHLVGRISPRGGWTGFHLSIGSWSKVAVTPSGQVAMPETGQLYRPDGKQVGAFSDSNLVTCGFCDIAAAGPHFVVQRRPEAPGVTLRGTWLWSPPTKPQQVPDGYRALGRLGGGWVGAPDGTGPGVACWRVAAASTPAATGARICSQALPLVSADGVRAAVVQGGRVRVVDTRTGAGISLARAALASWTPQPAPGGAVRYLVPVAWENADSYLVSARDGQMLALVRCSARTGRCERVVRSSVRTGVTHIVTERGPEEIVLMG